MRLSLILTCIVTLNCFVSKSLSALFLQETKEPDNIVILASGITIAGTLGYTSGILLGATTAGLLCAACSDGGDSKEIMSLTSLTLFSSLGTALFIKGAGSIFSDRRSFWPTFIGTSVGSLSLPIAYAVAKEQYAKPISAAIIIAALPTVIGGLIGYLWSDSAYRSSISSSESNNYSSFWQLTPQFDGFKVNYTYFLH